MIPALRVLVSGALDPNVSVGYEEFDVAAAGFEVVVDGVILVFANVVGDVEEFTLCWVESID